MRRLPHLDVLRGVAMLGILPVNLLYMANPVQRLPRAEVWGDPAGEVAAHAYVYVVHEFEFITLFSWLFGAGMALSFRGVGESAEAYAPIMLRRLLVLWPIGILHGVLLWQGDIVSSYAPLGLVLCWCVLLPRAAQVTLGTLGIAFSFGLIALFSVLGDAKGTWQAEWQIAAFHDGTLGEVIRARAVDWLWVMLAGVLVYGGRLGGLFLLGMAVVQAGWMDTVTQHRRRWLAVAVVGVVLGLAGESFAWWLAQPDASGEVSSTAHAAGEPLHYLTSLVLATGYGAGVVWLTDLCAGSRLLTPLAAVGRTAFSNYILQSVCMNLLFLPFLGGLYADVTHVELLGLAAAIWVVELVVSTLWLRWFHRGPLEWAWRSLTYWRLEPVLRRAGTPPPPPPPAG